MKFQQPTRLACLEKAIDCWRKRACQPCLMAYREAHRRGLLGRITDIPDIDVVDMLERWGGLDIWLGNFSKPQKLPTEPVGIDLNQGDLVEILQNKTRRNPHGEENGNSNSR